MIKYPFHFLRRSVAALAYTGVMIAFLAYCSDKKTGPDNKKVEPELVKESHESATATDAAGESVTL